MTYLMIKGDPYSISRTIFILPKLCELCDPVKIAKILLKLSSEWVLSTGEHGFEYMVYSANSANSFIQKFQLDFCGRIHRAHLILTESKCRRHRTFSRKPLLFYWRKISYFHFTHIFRLVCFLFPSFRYIT